MHALCHGLLQNIIFIQQSRSAHINWEKLCLEYHDLRPSITPYRLTFLLDVEINLHTLYIVARMKINVQPLSWRVTIDNEIYSLWTFVILLSCLGTIFLEHNVGGPKP